MTNHLKYNNWEFLLYNGDLNPLITAEILHKDIDPSSPEYQNLPLLNAEEFNSRLLFKKRTRDKILEEEGISSYLDISAAYELLKFKSLNKSKRVRELVLEKYIEIIEDVRNNTESSGSMQSN